eukprot:455772-Alexandrium_andersonii.AAC.1
MRWEARCRPISEHFCGGQPRKCLQMQSPTRMQRAALSWSPPPSPVSRGAVVAGVSPSHCPGCGAGPGEASRNRQTPMPEWVVGSGAGPGGGGGSPEHTPLI